jgi:hypothetical protein
VRGGREEIVDEKQRGITGHDIEFERREWKVQRVAWVVMTLIIVAAAVGLFGNGVFAEADKTAADGSVRVDYHRIARHHQPRTLAVDVSPQFVAGGEIRIWLGKEYVNELGLQNIIPEPESTEIEPDRVVYTFTAGEGEGPFTITFYYESDGVWRQTGRLGVVDGAEITFSQFVFP